MFTALPAFLAYEIAHHGLRAYGPSWRPEALMHEDTRGCLLDFCGTRADIEIKLHTGDFCTQCQEGLRAAGMPMERLLRVAEAIRELAAAPQTAASKPNVGQTVP